MESFPSSSGAISIQRVVSVGEDIVDQPYAATAAHHRSAPPEPQPEPMNAATTCTTTHDPNSSAAHVVEAETTNTTQQQQQYNNTNAARYNNDAGGGDPMDGMQEDEEETATDAPLRVIEQGAGGTGASGISSRMLGYNNSNNNNQEHNQDSSSSLSSTDDDSDRHRRRHHHHHHGSTSSRNGREQLVTLQQEAPPKPLRRVLMIGGGGAMAAGGLQRMSSAGGDSISTSSQRPPGSNHSGDWFFGDLHLDEHGNPIRQNYSSEQLFALKDSHKSGNDGNEPSANLTAPNYVLEESLSSQKLWKQSAGHRPPQPVEERAFYEKMWAQNFARSQVDYQMPVEVLTAASPMSLNPFADGNFEHAGVAGDYATPPQLPQSSGGGDVAEGMLVRGMNDHDRLATTVVNKKVKTGEGDLTVLVRGDNVFGTTVSKSFARSNANGDPIAGVDTINISIASYRVVESKKLGKYAQFLVIYREGSIRDTVGLWKRYSDFEELAHKVTHSHESCAVALANISPLSVAEESETEHLPNAITSWRLLKKRQRWYRCLDAGYLSLKVFLLERFLHDILFESSSPHLLRDFVGVSEDLL